MATTFEHRAMSAMSTFHWSKISSRLPGEPTHAQRGAEVVEHQLRAGHGTSQIGELAVLVVVVPRVVGEAALAQVRDATAERWIGVQARLGATGNHQHLGLDGVRARVADAAEQPLPGLFVRVEDLVEVLGVAEVGVGDDARR